MDDTTPTPGLETATAATAATPSAGLAWGVSAAWLAGSLALGAVLGTAGLVARPTAQKVAPEAPEPRQLTRPAGPAESIFAGDFEGALRQCHQRLESATADDRAGLLYLTAVSFEAAGDLPSARAAYAESEATAEGPLKFAAALGHVRCRLRSLRGVDDADRATVLSELTSLELAAGEPSLRPFGAQADLAYLRAEWESTRTPPTPAPSPRNPDGLARTAPPFPAARILSWLEPTPAADVPTAEGFRVERHPREPGRHRITGRSPDRPAADLLLDVAAAVELELHLPADATDALSARSVGLELDRMSLADLLNGLLEPSDLVWRFDGGRLLIAAPPPGPPAPNRPRESARAALARAVASAPEHPAKFWAELEIATLDLLAGRAHDAADAFERVRSDPAARRERPVATFNLGLTLRRLDDPLAAAEMFRLTIDLPDGEELASLAWWWLGRTHLDAADTSESVRAFRRAASSRADEAIRADAALAMATALSIEGRPARSHEALRSVPASVLRRPALRDEAAFLDALARHRQNRDDPRLTEELLRSLVSLSDDPPTGPAGAWLRGEAYRSLGMGAAMARIYERTLPGVRGGFAFRMARRLGEHHRRAGDPDAAARYLLAVAAADPLGEGVPARFLLAEMALERGSPAECRELCRALLRDAPTRKAEALRLMGRAYEAEAEYALAAECFAGRAP